MDSSHTVHTVVGNVVDTPTLDVDAAPFSLPTEAEKSVIGEALAGAVTAGANDDEEDIINGTAGDKEKEVVAVVVAVVVVVIEDVGSGVGGGGVELAAVVMV